MTRLRILIALFVLVTCVFAQEPSTCKVHAWSGIDRYRNVAVPVAKNGPRVVLMGASTVERWDLGKTFPTGNFINRGIGGQGTAQMLLRFHQDVVQLRPRLVVIFPGLNDLAGANGPVPLSDIQQNIDSMAQLAKANGIRVLFASLFPVDPNGTHPYLKLVSSERIREVNRWMFQYAKDHGDTYVDMWSPLGDEKYNLLSKYSADGIHINEQGYALISPVLQKAVAEANTKSVGRVSIKSDFKGEE